MDETKNEVAIQFQLTHSRGVRLPANTGTNVIINDFNSRTHVECDVFAGIQTADRKHFNSRTHVECDAGRHCQRLQQR